MPTPLFVCGAECGIAALSTSSGGVEHWSSTGSVQSVVTSGPSPMRSTRCFRFNPTASTGWLRHTFGAAIASPATMVVRFYIYFATLPAADMWILMDHANTYGYGVMFVQATSTLEAFRSGGIAAGGGITVTTGQWYRVDARIIIDTTRSTSLRVDGVAATGASAGGAAGTQAGFDIGAISTGTADFYIDDIIVSGTSGDYPIGPGKCVGLYPNGDRTETEVNPSFSGFAKHYYSAVSDFGKGSGGGTNLGAQNVESTSWQSLAKPLSTQVATNFLADKTGASNERLGFNLEDMPVDATDTINGVILVAATHSASNTANNFQLTLINTADGFTGDGNINTDLSESTITIPCTIVPSVNGAAWTVQKLNDMGAIWLSSDVNPDVYLDGFCLEVDYVPQSGGLALPRRSWKRSRELINMGGF